MHRLSAIALIALIALSAGVFTFRFALPLVADLGVVAIEGNSMGDALPIGSLAYLDHPDRYAVGDVVTFRVNGHTITHRITVDISGTGQGLFWTQGDASLARDPFPIDAENIAGRVTAHLPVMGLISTWLSQPLTIVFIGLLAGLLLFGPTRTGLEEAPLPPGTIRTLEDL